MARKLSMMYLQAGDVFLTATLDDKGKVTLEGEDDNFRSINGPKGRLRPADGEAYFNALKKLFDRSTFAVAFEPDEEAEARRIVGLHRQGKGLPAEPKQR